MSWKNFAATLSLNVIRNFVWHKAPKSARPESGLSPFLLTLSVIYSSNNLATSAPVWQKKKSLMMLAIRLRLLISSSGQIRFSALSHLCFSWCETKCIKDQNIYIKYMHFHRFRNGVKWVFIWFSVFDVCVVSNDRCQCLLYNRNKLPLWCKSNAQKDKHVPTRHAHSTNRILPLLCSLFLHLLQRVLMFT